MTIQLRGPVQRGPGLREFRFGALTVRMAMVLAMVLAVVLAVGLALGVTAGPSAAAAADSGNAVAHGRLSQLSAHSQVDDSQVEDSQVEDSQVEDRELPPPSGPASVRIGGSDPQPPTGTPGWVWWGVGSFVLALAVGTYRVWRATTSQ